MRRPEDDIEINLEEFAKGLSLLSEDELTTALLAIPMKLAIEALNGIHTVLDTEGRLTSQDMDDIQESAELLGHASDTMKTVVEDHRKIGKNAEENN
jgi:hypothetical protein